MINKFLSSSRLSLTFLIFCVTFGLYKYVSLPKESDPDISLPVTYVSLKHEGISTFDSERLLIKPLEKELKNIEGIKKISSTSHIGCGNIVLEFDAGFKSEKALSDTREKWYKEHREHEISKKKIESLEKEVSRLKLNLEIKKESPRNNLIISSSKR